MQIGFVVQVVSRISKPAAAPKSLVIALLDRTRAMNLAIPLTKLNKKPVEIKVRLLDHQWACSIIFTRVDTITMCMLVLLQRSSQVCKQLMVCCSLQPTYSQHFAFPLHNCMQQQQLQCTKRSNKTYHRVALFDKWQRPASCCNYSPDVPQRKGPEDDHTGTMGLLSLSPSVKHAQWLRFSFSPQAALMTLDGEGLTLENLEALLKMVPTDDEAKNVKLFLQVSSWLGMTAKTTYACL